jgi:hypothetical protein
MINASGNWLKSFYGNLKGLDEYLKFVFITSVSKFSNVSVFSDLNDLDEFFKILESLFASIPYDIFVKEREGYYNTIIYLLLTLIGIDVKSEVHTNQGRIDAVMETEDNIYIMEYKLGTAEQAMAQIKKMKYYEKFLTSKKNIKLIGIGFDTEKKNIGDYKIEGLQR